VADFSYQGVDRTGKKVSGTVSAGSEGDVRMVLRGKGVRPTRISRSGPSGTGSKPAVNLGLSLFGGGTPSLTTDALLIFTRQLYVLITSGVPLVQALETLLEQTVNPNLKTILTNVRAKVSAGAYFWESLSAYPRGFSKLYVSLVRAGEASGTLDMMLKRLTRYIEDAARIQRLLKSAMIYPMMVVLVGILVIVGMMMFVIPKFEAMLKSSGQTLPTATQMVIDASHFLVTNWIPLVGVTGAGGFMLVRFVQSSEGRAVVDRLLFRVPIFGPLMQIAGVARFSRTMQTLLASGVSLLDAIEVCKQTVDNAVLEEAVGKIRAEVETGKTLGAVVDRMGVFPKMAVHMIGVGEATGNLDQMLEKVADFYEAEVETLVNGMTKMIEPIILVVLGGSVGGLLIAMYLPIFQMAGGAE
jgi:type IV pilus assembly protein PilC